MTGAELPEGVRDGVAAALGIGRHPDPIQDLTPITGGCIHPAARVETRGGKVAFLKWSTQAGWTGFPVEARGLLSLSDRGGVRTPRVLGVAPEGSPEQWLLLEYIAPGGETPASFEILGPVLARLHRPIEGGLPGWDEDGWIGPLHQANRWIGSDRHPTQWPRFWRDLRLSPQWRRAADHLDSSTRSRWDRLMDLVDVGLSGWEDDGVSLLHGDLWSGNVLMDLSGNPVLVDPAVYRGHREVDLAMMELFGGFPPATLRRYREEAPLRPGYEEVRRDLYQLYPLLVHVNLFGSGYAAGVATRVARLTAAMAGR